jgi:hypothetical protein
VEVIDDGACTVDDAASKCGALILLNRQVPVGAKEHDGNSARKYVEKLRYIGHGAHTPRHVRRTRGVKRQLWLVLADGSSERMTRVVCGCINGHTEQDNITTGRSKAANCIFIKELL